MKRVYLPKIIVLITTLITDQHIADRQHAPLRWTTIASAIFTTCILLSPILSVGGQSLHRPVFNKREALNREELLEAESLLYNLGYWVGPVDGYADEATNYAALSFQRVVGLLPTGILSTVELRVLKAALPIKPRSVGDFHIEVNLSKQVLYLVYPNGSVNHVLPVNTGSGKVFTEGGWTRRANTPTGSFTVYRKIDGWRHSPLGLMYYPSYIKGGIAIHGSNEIPKFPATHGCIAVPLFAAKELSKLIPIGTVVLSYKDPIKLRSHIPHRVFKSKRQR